MMEIGVPVQRIRNAFATTAVTTGAWVELDASLNNQSEILEIFNSSTSILEFSTGASGAEASHIIPMYVLPSGGNGRIRMNLGKNTRLTVRAVDANASAGELILNFFI